MHGIRIGRALCLLMAVLLCIACSAGEVATVARVASTGSPASVKRMAVEKAVRYALSPATLSADVRRFNELVERFRQSIASIWGEEETRESSPTEYVKYTENYRSRATVDFDGGIITVETIADEKPLESLRNAIITTLLTPNDPRAVDLYSARAVTLGKEPFLLGEIRDFEGHNIRWHWRADRFAGKLIERNLRTRTVSEGGKLHLVRFVQIPMVPDHLEIRAAKYRTLVDRYARKYDLSGNLVYAIMKTESNFNPYAVSSAPAYGLMQIVSATAGSDVYRFLNNRQGSPSREFLFDPENNIHYGCAYLHLLASRYLKEIENPTAKEYCIIAAYNAGAGAVLRTFDSDRDRAPDRINMLQPLDVFETIRSQIAKEEARHYLVKVVTAKKAFVNY